MLAFLIRMFTGEVITNADYAQKVGFPKGWIVRNTFDNAHLSGGLHLSHYALKEMKKVQGKLNSPFEEWINRGFIVGPFLFGIVAILVGGAIYGSSIETVYCGVGGFWITLEAVAVMSIRAYHRYEFANSNELRTKVADILDKNRVDMQLAQSLRDMAMPLFSDTGADRTCGVAVSPQHGSWVVDGVQFHATSGSIVGRDVTIILRSTENDESMVCVLPSEDSVRGWVMSLLHEAGKKVVSETHTSNVFWDNHLLHRIEPFLETPDGVMSELGDMYHDVKAGSSRTIEVFGERDQSGALLLQQFSYNGKVTTFAPVGTVTLLVDLICETLSNTPAAPMIKAA